MIPFGSGAGPYAAYVQFIIDFSIGDCACTAQKLIET